ncbi:acanthoscurrin-1-like [Pieris rapae]|uniref:acanthoscurrin-1-like n=1 Tax=Pieris rapae TaxID=64459 RepID=UPI001E27D370|nr:acanthoscurrin-1-like [Pieris rapae]
MKCIILFVLSCAALLNAQPFAGLGLGRMGGLGIGSGLGLSGLEMGEMDLGGLGYGGMEGGGLGMGGMGGGDTVTGEMGLDGLRLEGMRGMGEPGNIL